MTQAIVALGGNLPSALGGPAETLRAAIGDLEARGLRVSAISRFFRTPCFPAGAGPDYVNAALTIETDLPPAELLELLHAVEAAHGRARVQRWGMRTLDLDLVAVGAAVLPDVEVQAQWRGLDPALQRERAPETLILPHPRLQDRAFVLVPVADVAPLWRHPLLGLTVAEMLARLPQADIDEVVPIGRP